MIDYANDDEEDDYISRSHFKREAEAMQALGERLITLRKEQLDQLDLSEKLYDSILLAQRLTPNGAIPRQRQFIGRDPLTVVADPHQRHPTLLQFHLDRPGAGVDRILDQFLDHRRRPLDDFAGGNLVDQQFREDMDGHARRW